MRALSSMPSRVARVIRDDILSFRHVRMNVKETENYLHSKVIAKMAIIAKEYDMHIIPVPKIKLIWYVTSYNGRTKFTQSPSKAPVYRARGQVNPYAISKCSIILSILVYKIWGLEEFMRVFLHEYAHLITIDKYATNGHSRAFKKICTAVGGCMNEHWAGEEFKEAATKKFL